MRIFKRMCACAAVALVAFIANDSARGAERGEGLAPEEFARLHAMVGTQPGESLYRQIPWLTSVWEARKQAAALGRPIFIWAGSGGGPIGVC